jgi:hypothetical protein
MVALVRSAQQRRDVAAIVARRFGGGPLQPLVGEATQLLDHFGALASRGVERFYVWFADFAEVPSLLEFGETVAAALGSDTH